MVKEDVMTPLTALLTEVRAVGFPPHTPYQQLSQEAGVSAAVGCHSTAQAKLARKKKKKEKALVENGRR